MNSEDPLDKFIELLPDFHKWDGKKQTDYLAFHLQRLNHGIFTVGLSSSKIMQAFRDIPLTPYDRIARYLSEEATKARNGKYVKVANGYLLSKPRSKEIEKEFSKDHRTQQVTESLSRLKKKVKDEGEAEFLDEVISCYEHGSNRAAIVMMWTLAVAHLRNSVINEHLVAFNAAIDTWNTNHPKSKNGPISHYEDFGEIQESRFIELLRISKIITKQERELLDERLKTRNAAGHPTTFKINSYKVTEFIADLVDNILI